MPKKTYILEVDDFIIYRKKYYVEAQTAKEAKQIFKAGSYLDVDDTDDTDFSHSVVRKVIVAGVDETAAGDCMEICDDHQWQCPHGKVCERHEDTYSN